MITEGVFKNVGGFVSHPLIRPSSLEFREYQVKIAERCLSGNTLLTLPTGLGKTFVALLVAAERLRTNPDSWCAVLAPTKPLVNQHYETFMEKLFLPKDAFRLWTGDVSQEQRIPIKRGILFSTPQTFRNELIKGLDLSDLVLLVFDEAHRAVGNYPYAFSAQVYCKTSRSPLILAMTASPAHNEEKLMEVSKNLAIKRYEIRTERAEEVKPFVKDIEFKLVPVLLPDLVLEARSLLLRELHDQLESPRTLGLIKSANPTFREITEAMKSSRAKAEEGIEGAKYVTALMNLAIARRLKMAIERLDLGGPSLMLSFMRSLAEKSRRMGAIKSLKVLFSSRKVNDAIELVRVYTSTQESDPKQDELLKVLERENTKGVRRMIVFVSYREVAKQLVEFIDRRGKTALRPYLLIGHARRGMSSSQQLDAISRFKEGAYNVLVATQVGEEGLDITGSDVVVFYDNTPSALRFVQRTGRTGRVSPGRVYIMFFKNTLDEKYLWIAKRRELRMKKVISDLSKDAAKGEESEDASSLRVFMKDEQEVKENRAVIIVDNREQNSEVVEKLLELGVEVKFTQLQVADYVLSDRVAVERKTVRDFASSIMDGRLFSQARELKEQYQVPILLIEGEGLYEQPGISKNALLGAISSLAIDFCLPIIQVRDAEETSRLFYLIVLREQTKERRMPRVREGRKPISLYEMQVYLLSGLPFVERTTAERLLSKFKTPAAVFNATEKDLMQIDGIGEKKARAIKEVVERESKKEGDGVTNSPL